MGCSSPPNPPRGDPTDPGGSGYLVGLGKALQELLHVGTQLHVDLGGNSSLENYQHPHPGTKVSPEGGSVPSAVGFQSPFPYRGHWHRGHMGWQYRAISSTAPNHSPGGPNHSPRTPKSRPPPGPPQITAPHPPPRPRGTHLVGALLEAHGEGGRGTLLPLGEEGGVEQDPILGTREQAQPAAPGAAEPPQTPPDPPSSPAP